MYPDKPDDEPAAGPVEPTEGSPLACIAAITAAILIPFQSAIEQHFDKINWSASHLSASTFKRTSSLVSPRGHAQSSSSRFSRLDGSLGTSTVLLVSSLIFPLESIVCARTTWTHVCEQAMTLDELEDIPTRLVQFVDPCS